VKYNLEFNKNPVNKILVSGRGRKNPNRYPMRVFMYNLSLNDDRIDYFKPDHNYRINIEKYEQVMCGEKYIKKLNQYRVCFSDDAIHYSPYLVCKFFEILSSGALLLASLTYTKTYFLNLGFIDGEHYISISKEDYNEKIQYVLDEKNHEEIDKIRLAGYNLCNKYHTSEHRALQLKEIIEDTDNVKKYTDGIGGTEYYLVNNSLTIQKKNYISLGPNCKVAMRLRDLHIRKESLPFDFLLTQPLRGLEYVTDLIKNGFSDFVENLSYDHRGRVFSNNYTQTLFFHHDLIKDQWHKDNNVIYDHTDRRGRRTVKKIEESQIEKFKRRGKRFLELIQNEINILFYTISYKYMNENSSIFFSTVDNFIYIMNKKSNNKYLLIILFDDVQLNDDIKIDYNNQYVYFHPFSHIAVDGILDGVGGDTKHKKLLEQYIKKYDNKLI